MFSLFIANKKLENDTYNQLYYGPFPWKKHFNSFYFNKYISRIRLRLGHRVRIDFVSDIQ